MGADYSFELISIETYAPQFIEHNKVFLGSVLPLAAFGFFFAAFQIVHSALGFKAVRLSLSIK